MPGRAEAAIHHDVQPERGKTGAGGVARRAGVTRHQTCRLEHCQHPVHGGLGQRAGLDDVGERGGALGGHQCLEHRERAQRGGDLVFFAGHICKLSYSGTMGSDFVALLQSPVRDFPRLNSC